MPEISRFFGIRILMFYNDHAPPHFHAEYGGERVSVEIQSLAVIEGRIPRRPRDGHRVGSRASARTRPGLGARPDGPAAARYSAAGVASAHA